MSIGLASSCAFTGACARAADIDFAAYTLHAGAVRDALAAAARAGARVRVRLEGRPVADPKGGLAAMNAATVAALCAAGADATLTPPGSPLLHLKAAVVDGVAWLDDRNWTGGAGETVVRDTDAADVAAVRDALGGGPGSAPGLRCTKAEAEALETKAIARAGRAPLAVATESLGVGPVYDAVLARARTGLPTRLLVASGEASAAGPAGIRERALLERLTALGVAVRGGAHAAEKLAIGDRCAWVGSANATYAGDAAAGQRDWGLLTADPTVVDGLRRNFERDWRAAASGSLGVPAPKARASWQQQASRSKPTPVRAFANTPRPRSTFWSRWACAIN